MKLNTLLSIAALICSCNNPKAKEVKKNELPRDNVNINCIVNSDLIAYLDSYINSTRVIESSRIKDIYYSMFFTKNEFNDTIFTISGALNPISLIDSNYEAKGWFEYQDKIIVVTDNKNNLILTGTNFYNSSCLKPIDTTFREMLISSPFIEPEVTPYRFWNLTIKHNKVIKVVKSK